MDPDTGSSQSIEMMCLFKIKSRFSVESDRTIKKKKPRGKQTLQAFSGEGDGWLLTSRRQESLCRRLCFSWKRITKWRFTLLLKSHGRSLSGSPLLAVLLSDIKHWDFFFFFENSVLDYLFWTQQSLPRCVMSQYISTMVLSVQGKPDPGSDES